MSDDFETVRELFDKYQKNPRMNEPSGRAALDRIRSQLRSLTEENERLKANQWDGFFVGERIIDVFEERDRLEAQLSTQAEELERLRAQLERTLDHLRFNYWKDDLNSNRRYLAVQQIERALQPPTQQGEGR